MRRSDEYKKINRNSGYMFNNPNRATPNLTPSNLLSSDIFVEHMWLRDDNITTGVQIIELRSSDSDKSVNDDKDWNNARPISDDNYKVNQAARENRRVKNQNLPFPYDFSLNSTEEDEDYRFTDIFASPNRDSQKENLTYNHQVNCFTILDNHLDDSDTSGEEYANIEYLDYGGGEWGCNSKTYESEIVSYIPEAENEKRTVWIYSFKNKHLLSENNFELVNIPSQETSSGSIDDFQPENEIKSEYIKRRTATPIPPTYVPRLNLSTNPTLPTVTEVTEPEKPTSSIRTDTSNKQSQRTGHFKTNNWFLSEQPTPTSEKSNTLDKATSVVNWMALSPRAKRRWFRNVNPITISSEKSNRLPILKEVTSQSESVGDALNTEGKGDHQDTSFIDEERSQSEKNQLQNIFLDKMSSITEDSARKSVRSFNSMTSPKANENVESIEETASNIETPKDRGDHNKNHKIPRIKVSSKCNSKNITDPMENLESENWIQEEKIIEENDQIDRTMNARGDSASEALWIRNLSLLKPAQWTEYLPITESLPSLHLSINTESDENVPWFRRIARWFRCCK